MKSFIACIIIFCTSTSAVSQIATQIHMGRKPLCAGKGTLCNVETIENKNQSHPNLATFFVHEKRLLMRLSKSSFRKSELNDLFEMIEVSNGRFTKMLVQDQVIDIPKEIVELSAHLDSQKWVEIPRGKYLVITETSEYIDVALRLF